MDRLVSYLASTKTTGMIAGGFVGVVKNNVRDAQLITDMAYLTLS